MDLPAGKHILSEKIANLESVYGKLPDGFRGVIRIFIKADDRSYKCDLLVDDGSILCVSLGNDSSIYGEAAFEELKKEVLGDNNCDVEIYLFNDAEMSLAFNVNEKIMFKSALSLDRFKEICIGSGGNQDKVDNGVGDGFEGGLDEAKVAKAYKAEQKPSEAVGGGDGRNKKEDEDWLSELGACDEEWHRLEVEWEKIDSKELSVGVDKTLSQVDEVNAVDEGGEAVESTDDKMDLLKTKPLVVKTISFADKLRFFRFPNALTAMGLMNGKRTLKEIAGSLNLGEDVIIDLADKLTQRGYIK